ncbi:UDP-N-acetylmuramoyl-L-alanine--D-glutamate ligase [Nostoc sp. FACHB-87]|uniref:UDP-N-acetylmuramoyl-L-alanine--D-glutamate ligase n=1 Tax=Nostocales TaxID=1161 RepID=UPI001689B315|nr:MULTISPECIES: UDP-N-acetylmuramoyl-L-alanine--D-glutamate ligase [Nostocales]MBD2453791.1 UDP-N-acetylmuramoyl-L-alanine--D-glutamate ligase [Nostoc sp. FACHB-87]MBD2475253.1 UDP-N-acetylmuramoyl-L-alanine--D-glutamate ligase [Anabaena sp. FACHB-83]MBD2488962.1 UDP-N-acetylmuramoyl-L-alanine--D-glutamate ligase [Aulosira sp. FACHB-615]
MSKAHVIGLGKSGVAAARLLKREGWEVDLGDRNTSDTFLQQQQELAAEQITVKLGYSLDLTDTDLPQLIVVSPGVPWDIPVLVKARELGIETIGEMELAWRHLKSQPWVAITGTNGKTTTTALIAAIFQAAGFDAPACGNIGYAACEVALSPKLPDWVIGEISSYQIESSSSLAPRIGVWTTFTPDHLARHQTLENYYDIKAKLLKQSQLQVFNGDDAYLNKVGLNHWPDAYWTSVKGQDFLIGDKGFYIEDGWVIEKINATSTPTRIIPASALRMVGEHNLQNLLMAVAAARLADIQPDAITKAIEQFPGVPHRLEHICTWEGVDFINDSKATNYDAAEVGLASVKSPTILIAGGEAKPGDDTGWLAKIQAKAASVLLIGAAAPAFAQRLQEVGYTNYEIVETMAKAVPRSAELAKQHQAPVVLLSPACASFDQYPNFEVRGDDFRQLCLAWAAR